MVQPPDTISTKNHGLHVKRLMFCPITVRLSSIFLALFYRIVHIFSGDSFGVVPDFSLAFPEDGSWCSARDHFLRSGACAVTQNIQLPLPSTEQSWRHEGPEFVCPQQWSVALNEIFNDSVLIAGFIRTKWDGKDKHAQWVEKDWQGCEDRVK